MIWVRFGLLVIGIVTIIASAISAFFGRWVIPNDLQQQFPISWAIEFPGQAVAAATLVFVAALLWRPGRTVYVKDFRA